MTLAVALFGILAAVVVAQVGQSPAPADISGPCDEAEHRFDPRCTAAQPRVEDNTGRVDDDGGRGRGRGDDDSSGHGPGHDGEDD